ncbi:hypothetical protein PR003_g28785 [Phytophthora rubi]|uniref:Uncharacterized protein n=1 Tax=Phytophthora rubi TaxID=129364 RepID=A0A6A4BS56_9STRA|nr:hypothetical protein PR003_g28785 [Phytophthora rubi]
MRTHFTFDDDKQLVNIARRFIAGGTPVSWNDVARHMRSTGHTAAALRQRLHALCRTWGRDIARFPASSLHQFDVHLAGLLLSRGDFEALSQIRQHSMLLKTRLRLLQLTRHPRHQYHSHPDLKRVLAQRCDLKLTKNQQRYNPCSLKHRRHVQQRLLLLLIPTHQQGLSHDNKHQNCLHQVRNMLLRQFLLVCDALRLPMLVGALT